MTVDQTFITVLLAAMLIAFAMERWRVETVALAGLTVAYLGGLVPATAVFTGFASPAVVTVIEILLIVTVLARSSVIEEVVQIVAARISSERALIALLCSVGALVSVFMNNIGALALLFPVSLSFAQKLNMAPGRVLMPLSFATLLGGMCSLTGTPANLVVNEWMVTETGRGLAYFQLGEVGGLLVLAGIAWLVLATPRIFARLGAAADSASGVAAAPADLLQFVAQRTITARSRLPGMSLAQAEEAGNFTTHGVLRGGRHLFARRDAIVLQEGDDILIEGTEADLAALEANARLAGIRAGDEQEVMKAVVMPESLLVGSRVEDVEPLSGGQVRVDGLASRRGRIEGRFTDLQFSMGDVVALVGPGDAVRMLAREAGLLLLSSRQQTEPVAPRGLAAGLFVLGVAVTALGLAPVEIAFGAVVVALVATGLLDLRRALAEINWRVIILLGCMIPLGLAVEQTGAARVLADTIAEGLPAQAPMLVIAAVLAMGIVLTPFIDNVSTAVVLSPIAAELAVRTGTPIEPLLIAVAIGASIDFLTPFGHHNNAMVMGAGNYRFGDFSRLGAPLTVICFVVALVALRAFY
ncbi:cation transporter [Erythrobacter arachoides]|uniref:Cation transporter n=1 Tax=Aurantiacibacter arachoides TaxID=1850444 RepID=A0A845A1S7_9SPHN|nr:SLC13 family permease [Aurantiacibacter arachoides]MXO93878.1 cation transporter [Aurantiacibacter arachoides]GGD46020.1 potassium transporter TrkA [Aurantiacibacter arachoides]